MKKFVSILFALILGLGVKTYAQSWQYQGIFPPAPDTLKTNTGVQFVAVDPDGKIWIAPFRTNVDSFYVADSSKWYVVRPVYVYKPDGTPWDTIRAVTISGKVYPFYNSKYGITTDNNGNILVNDYNALYRINYKTGQGMNYVNPGISALCDPAVDANGNIYLAPVLPGHPLVMYDANFSFLGNAIDNVLQYGRWIAVSKDGNTLYVPRFSQKNLFIYHRNSSLDPFVFVDSVLQGITCESGAWDPVNGNLWLSMGSYFDPPLGALAGNENKWFEYDVNTWTVKDSISWNIFLAGDVNERPRGIAFSPDGKDAYVACFGSSTYPPVEKFFNNSHVTAVEKENSQIVSNYSLSQNYPNPFNPTTEISYSVAKAGFVTLKVYDLLGRLVTTLVNESKSTGNYTVRFDASKLASGTYIYQMNAGGVLISKKMILLK
ncbi:MAG: T9SS type A sorting domain-containing protein [Ignavibacteriaceae bacterium]